MYLGYVYFKRCPLNIDFTRDVHMSYMMTDVTMLKTMTRKISTQSKRNNSIPDVNNIERAKTNFLYTGGLAL